MISVGPSSMLPASRRRSHGATLVEIALACVLLLLLAIGGAAYMTHSRATVAVQRNRRIALEVATARIEDLRMTGYGALAALMQPENYQPRYLEWSGATWSMSTADPGETTMLNGVAHPMVTQVSYVDVDAGTARDNGQPNYDALSLRVEVGYRLGNPARVALETIHAP